MEGRRWDFYGVTIGDIVIRTTDLEKILSGRHHYGEITETPLLALSKTTRKFQYHEENWEEVKKK